MPLSDILAAALSRPAGRVVDGPVRTIVREVLADRGYASPAEVQALRDEISGLANQLNGLVSQLDGTRTELEGVRTSLSSVQEEMAVAVEKATRMVLSTPTEPAVPCKVSTCDRPGRRDGLCQDCWYQWMAGTLPGVVGPEGLFEIDGQPHRVDSALAGMPFMVSDGDVQVDGKTVMAEPVG
jgi:hypothetical protein